MTAKDIKQNYNIIREKVNNASIRCGRLPGDIEIVAVSKTHPVELIKIGIKAGINIFGENYVQELKDKHEILSKEGYKPKWHFIGHLQTNKVKYIVPYVSFIHSVDSVKLAGEISKEAKKNNRDVNVLLQVNTSGELSKSGCEPGKAEELLLNVKDMENINISGLMTIGSFSEDENIYRKEFRLLKTLRDELQKKFPELMLKHLSMGMSHDFVAAIEEGATLIRIGTAIFGNRDYRN